MMTVWMKRWMVYTISYQIELVRKDETIQEEQFACRCVCWDIKCVGWGINCFKPYEGMTASILLPAFVLISLFHHDFDLTLKSWRINEKSDLKKFISGSIFSKFERKYLKSELVWLGDLCSTAM